MMGFEKQTRKNVRRAVKYGITTRIGTREDIPILYEMVEETARRQGFAHRPIDYFYRMYDAFAPEYLRLYIMEFEGEVCCASFVMNYGNKVWSVYSGTSDHHREKKATFLMRMEQIRWGLERGCEIYDLMGVPGKVPEDHPLYLSLIHISVLASVSRRYPPLGGRLLTRYSPVRHSDTVEQAPPYLRSTCMC